MRNPREKIVEVARRYLGVTESSENRFAGIQELWKATNYPDGWKNREPYCSAFVSMCVQVADAESQEINLRIPPRFAAVAEWLPWALDKRNGCLVFGPGSAHKPEPGDIVSFRPHLSHIGIVEAFDGKTVHTIEANTSSGTTGNQREGDGIFRKARAYNFCGSFIRVPCVGLKA